MKRTPADQARRRVLAEAAAGWPPGTLVTDTNSGLTGVLMEFATVKLEHGTRREAYLRPVGGGIEWTTEASAIRPVDGAAE